MLLSITIILYITSCVTALLFLFGGKNLNPAWFKVFASFHFIAAAFFVLNLISNKQENPHYLSFLLFICSGIICFGITVALHSFLPFKMYFGIFVLSFALFLLSPSTLFNFLLTARFQSTSERFLIAQENIYLERQNSAFSNDEKNILYKLTEKHGLFHKTISRNLNFNGKLDSIKVLSFNKKESVIIRGYSGKKTYVSDETDSSDITVDLNPKQRDEIERKL